MAARTKQLSGPARTQVARDLLARSLAAGHVGSGGVASSRPGADAALEVVVNPCRDVNW